MCCNDRRCNFLICKNWNFSEIISCFEFIYDFKSIFWIHDDVVIEVVIRSHWSKIRRLIVWFCLWSCLQFIWNCLLEYIRVKYLKRFDSSLFIIIFNCNFLWNYFGWRIWKILYINDCWSSFKIIDSNYRFLMFNFKSFLSWLPSKFIRTLKLLSSSLLFSSQDFVQNCFPKLRFLLILAVRINELFSLFRVIVLKVFINCDHIDLSLNDEVEFTWSVTFL